MSENRANPLLQAWLDEYDSIKSDFIDAVRDTGVKLGRPGSWQMNTGRLMSELEAKGAVLRNACASVLSGPISEACEACSKSKESQTFTFSLKCHRKCYFCFNPNQADYERLLHQDRDWRGEFAQLVQADRQLTHIALTGGEPLLRPEETISFFSEARRLWPKSHLRLYTTGDQLTCQMLESLTSSGMNEIRFSIKPDETTDERASALERLKMACKYADELNDKNAAVSTQDNSRRNSLDVMVEMPVLPGSFDEMAELLEELDNMGAFGINLLEFCYPFNNWAAFAERGFNVKNPPYPVMYNYEYAGSLPIEGSEEECLRLVLYALERGMNLGVHYCSLENKHRMQVHEQNSYATLNDPCYKMDDGDFFYKTVKAFGRDAKIVQGFLEKKNAEPTLQIKTKSWRYDAEDDCLLFHPANLQAVRSANLKTSNGRQIEPAISINILERNAGGLTLRELGLQPV